MDSYVATIGLLTSPHINPLLSINGKVQDKFCLNRSQGGMLLSASDYTNDIYVYILNADGKMIAQRKLGVVK